MKKKMSKAMEENKWRCQLQKSLKYFSNLFPMKNDVRFEYVQWQNVWWVYFNHTTEKVIEILY